MRIVITRREPLDVPDGINIFIFSLSDAFTRLGHEVHIMSTYLPDRDKIDKFYGHFKFRTLYGWLDAGEFPAPLTKRYISWRTKGMSILNGLDAQFCILNGAIPFLPISIPHVFVAHDLERRFVRSRRLQNFIKRSAYMSGVKVICTTNEIAKGLSQELGLPSSRMEVIPTCFRISEYEGRPLERREKSILHMGTAAYKQPLVSMKAFQMAGIDDGELLITGPTTAAMDAFVKSHPTCRIRCLGFVSDAELKSLLARVRAVSVPSVYDSPVASPSVLESFACGTPVVTTNSISGDVVVDNENCLVRDCQDAEFAEAFRLLLSDDPTWRRLSSNARRASEKFDARAVAQAYLDLHNVRH